MSRTPRMAPPYDIDGTQQSGNSSRGQRYQADHHRSLPRSAVTSRPPRIRRARSGSRDCRTSDRQRPRSRCFKSLGLVLVIVISAAFWHSFRHREFIKVNVAGGGDEEARLRRQVQGLEDTLRRKEALLAGAAPGGLPPEDYPSLGTDPTPLIRQSATPLRQSSPPRRQSTPLLRQSLESQPGLIREPVPLIVGGTDGSGTRGVVALLQRLKVPMVVEDRGTMDVHGAPYMVKGGWPEVARPVIEWARGTGYEPRAAPDRLRRKTFEALGNLRVKMQQLALRLRSPSKGEAAAKHVSWGFKAPISMVLVPFFEEAWGKAKFLHVVRDGRDIAFSGNQTPVEKFYTDMFPRGSRELGFQEDSLKAIALWDRWNVGVHEWAASREEEGGSGIDYLVLHAEDLIDPAAKFAAIKDVAEFVGSPLSDSELCCIATEVSKDMGSHTTSRKDRGKITTRFGKWKGKVDGQPQLSQLLHYEGERGLRLFGYEPERSLRASGGFQCAAERDPACPTAPSLTSGLRTPSRQKRAPANVEVPAHVSVDDTAGCVALKKEMDFQGFDVKAGHFEDHLGCCQECRKVHDCSFFTFDYNSGVCYLKSGKGAENPKLGLVSGMAQQEIVS